MFLVENHEMGTSGCLDERYMGKDRKVLSHFYFLTLNSFCGIITVSQQGIIMSDSPSYEMYTSFGDDAVDAIVRGARTLKLTWPQVHEELVKLSKKFDGQFSEATDTAVRENVFYALGFDKTKQPFYI